MRKLRLSPFQGELLLLLSEAGEENLACIQATLGPIDDVEFTEQIAGLRGLGLVRDSVETGNDRPSLVLTALGHASVLS